MNQNISPWLYQLNRTRPVDIITGDIDTDVVVVGGGISGVMTSYFLLKNTDREVTLVEGNKVAHGATGHNAGQIVSEFERPFTDLVREYGLQKTINAEEDTLSSWVLLDEIYAEAKLQTPLSSFMGYNGYKHRAHVVDALKANLLRRYAGSPVNPVYVAREWLQKNTLPEDFKDMYEVVPQADILSLLETENTEYICAIALKKGCTNSALLSEEIVGYLLATYKERFRLFEHTSVALASLNKDDVNLAVMTNRKDGNPEEGYKIHCNKVILCTNGFERIKLKNNVGDEIDAKFHHMVNGDIGYMAAYIEDLKHPPTALGYYDQGDDDSVSADAYYDVPYVYKTRRPYELEKNEMHNLICIGGPEEQIAETQDYDRYAPFIKEKGEIIDQFIKRNIVNHKGKDLEYRFQWHGIMCYTPTNMRVVGAEPKNPLLYYNLGCNGVGIMTSIFGASKISRLIKGEKFPPSIFDPKS
jgi:glycine/D-amino acid oxidase-like deaminating enzyme